MSTIWKNGKYQPLVKYVTLKDLKKLSNAIDIINGDSDTKGSIKKAIKDLVGEAPEAYDTLKEIADKLKSDDDLHKALNDAIILKASSDALNTEINRATSAETVNKNAIDGEVTRAKSAEKSLQDQITSNDSDITNLTAKHESLSRKVQDIAATGGASTATNVTYNNDNSGLNAENAQDAIDELQSSKIDKTSILQESGEAEDKIMSQGAVKTELGKKANTTDVDTKFTEEKNRVDGELGKKFDKGNIVQTTGESEDKVISQKATTTAIADETTRAKAAEKTNEETITNEVARLDKKIDTQKNEINAAKEDALQAIAKNEQSVIANFNAQRVTPEMLSESTKQLIEASGGGTITNLADDEDLTSVDDGTGSNVLKFADRTYNVNNFSGKGYKILRKNIQEVKIPKYNVTITNGCVTEGDITIVMGPTRTYTIHVTIDYSTPKQVAELISNSIYECSVIDATLSFMEQPSLNFNETGILSTNVSDISYTENRNVLTQSMVNDPNTVYEVRYDYLLNSRIILKEGSYLVYNGGKIEAIPRISGRITFYDNTDINTDGYNPFISDIEYKSNIINVNKETPVFEGSYNGIITRYCTINCNKPLYCADKSLNLIGDYTTRLLGNSRFYGNIKYNIKTLYKTIYLSEFIKNYKGEYHYASGTRGKLLDLYLLYNQISNTFVNDASAQYTIIIDIKRLYITNTINLTSNINLICPEMCEIYLEDKFRDNSNLINIFETSGGTNNAFRNTIEGFNIILQNGVYFNYFIKFNNKGNITNLKRIRILGVATQDEVNNYNGILRTYTEAYANNSQNPNGYSDFLYIEDVKGIIRIDKFDIIVGLGDCTEFNRCCNMKILCYGGQKLFKNCMQTQVYAALSDIVLLNNHNETAHYELYKSNATFNGCVIGNAVGENKATITINDDNFINIIKEYYNPTAAVLKELNNIILTNLILDNVKFAFNSVSECNGFKTNLYDIEVKGNNKEVNIISNNSYRYLDWLDYKYNLDIYSNIEINKQIIDKVPEDFITKNRTVTIFDTGKKLTALDSPNNRSYLYNDFLNYFETLIDDTYYITVKNIIFLLDYDRNIGIKKDINKKFGPLKNRNSIRSKILDPYYKGNYIINVDIDGILKHIKLVLLSDIISDSDFRCSKYSLFGQSYIENNITEYNECNNIDILNDYNVRAYLNEIPKYGKWNINDECVINNITYIYDGKNWIIKEGLSGTTMSRPTLNVPNGYVYFDTTLNKPIWWTEAGWVDALGTVVS